MKYYISDLHIFHSNAINFDKRPFKTLDEMHESIINNINNTCNRGDDLYILGDFLWKVNDDSISWASRINPCMHLIIGNHDKITDARYKRLFTEICHYKEITDNVKGINRQVVLSHFPIYSWNGQHKNWIHLYGHVHNSYEDVLYQKALAELNEYYKNRDGENYKPFYAYNVGCMQDYMDYTPRTLEEIIAANTKN